MGNKTDFVHLHCHTEFSMLDGMPKVEEYVIKCDELRMPAVAVTEHGNLRSIYQLQIRSQKKFEYKAKEYDLPPIKPIFGIEFYVSPSDYKVKGFPESEKTKIKRESKDSAGYKRALKKAEDELGIRKRYHLLAFAKNKKGLENLFTLNYLSWKNGFYYRPRIDMDLLKKYYEGIVVTTACIGGWAPDLVIRDMHDEADEWLKDLKVTFGDDMYVEIQPHDIDEQRIANLRMEILALDNKLKVIATNDCHYLDKEDYISHEVLLAIQSNKTMEAADRWRFDSTEFYMKSKSEMIQSFEKYHPEIGIDTVRKSLENTLEIVDKCSVELEIDRKKGLLPSIEIPDQYKNENKYLIDLCKIGWKWREISKRAEVHAKRNDIEKDEAIRIYKDRLKLELNRVFKLKFTKYFLMIYDLISWARSQDIAIGPGRGSSSGSMICYLLGITAIDPIEYDLLFDRFLNENRVDFPDVDMDFQDNRRKEIFSYLFEKYGEENVCQIGTVGRMKGKMAVLDVGRVFKVPVAETFIVNKHIIERSSGDARSNQTVEDSFNEFDVCKDYNRKYPDVLKHVIRLEGKARQVGIHAAGIQIAPTDISKIIPIEYRESSGERVKVSSLDWMECQGLGLVKIDVLGLKTLTILKTAVDKIYERHGVKVDLEKLSFDDEKVLGGFTDTNFIGIFQFDSVGMTMICRELDFTHFNDIMVMNALYRPSGMRSGWAKKYIPRKLGRDKIPKVHPIYDRITAETNGILLYQEQLIKTFVELAGYDPGTGDELRKKIAKSYGVETIGKEKEKFVEGAVKNGMDASSAKKLLEEMAFAGSYAFNKSHSAAYSAIAYWGMFLKVYYSIEFFYSLMYHENDKQEIMRFVTESRRVGIDVKMPDINKSDAGFAIGDNDEIRCGLIDIKGVGEKATAQIIGNQPFSSIHDMCEKVNRTAVNRGVIKSLIMSNSFKEMYGNTGALLATHVGGKKNKELPVWDWMLEMGEGEGNLLYKRYEQSLEPDYMMDEEHEVVMMSTVCPIPPPKHKIEYYKNVVRHLDKNFEIYGCTTLDWSKARVRLKGVLVEIKYNNVGDFHKEEPSDKIKRRIRWGSRYATFNIEDETGIKRSSVDIDTFPTFRRIIDKGLGTPILISGSTFQPNELVQSDVVVDMDEIRDILETDGTLAEKFMKMDKFQRYFLRHPVKPYRKKYPTYATCKTIMSKKSGSFRYIGLVVRIKYHWTRGKDKKMAFINVEDETDNLSLVVWSDSLAKYKHTLQLGNIIRCVVKREGDSCFIDGTVKLVKKYFEFV